MSNWRLDKTAAGMALDLGFASGGAEEALIARAIREAYEQGRRDENEACAKACETRSMSYYHAIQKLDLDDDHLEERLIEACGVACGLLGRDIRKCTPNADTSKEPKND